MIVAYFAAFGHQNALAHEEHALSGNTGGDAHVVYDEQLPRGLVGLSLLEFFFEGCLRKHFSFL